MRRTIDEDLVRLARPVIETASEGSCSVCGRSLPVSQHRDRYIWRLDELIHHVCRDRRCPEKTCEGRAQIWRPWHDIRLALPRMSFGLDVLIHVGEQHLGRGVSLSQLGRDLNDRGVPIHQTHVGELLRDYVALAKLCRGEEAEVRQRLIAQGGIRLMVDGVYHDDRSAALFLAWDARSGTVLLGERMPFRGEKDFKVLLQRVKDMGVPIQCVVTDAETGLVPAVQAVFPGIPYQLCKTHYLKNCARPMEADLKKLGESVERRDKAVRKLNKRLHLLQRKESSQADASVPPPRAQPSPQQPSPGPEPRSCCGSVVPSETESLDSAGAAPTPNPPLPFAAEPSPPPLLAAEASPPPSATLPARVASTSGVTEQRLVQQLCAMVRQNARASGKAPLNPSQLIRHQRLEQIRNMVDSLRKDKKKAPDRRSSRPGWMSSPRR